MNLKRAVPKPQAPRFAVKWVNGIWTIFDRVNFTNCKPDLGTRKNAERVLNTPPQASRR